MSGITVEEADAIQPAMERMSPPSQFGDKAFYWLTLSMAFAVVLLVILVGWELGSGSWQAIRKFGFSFLTTSTWDPVAEELGSLPFIYGTAVSSLIALIIAVPLSIATWHLHTNLCMSPKDARRSADFTKFGLHGSIATQEACDSAGGKFYPVIFGWMVHVYPYEDSTQKIFAMHHRD